MNTKPPQRPTRACGRLKAASCKPGKSQRAGTCASVPSRFQAKPWNGQLNRGNAALAVAQAHAAMQAAVIVGANLVRRGAHDDQRGARAFIDEVIAGLRDLLLAAGHPPHAGPQAFLLEAGEILAGVLRARHRGAGHVGFRIFAENGVRGVGVGGDHGLERGRGAGAVGGCHGSGIGIGHRRFSCVDPARSAEPSCGVVAQFRPHIGQRRNHAVGPVAESI